MFSVPALEPNSPLNCYAWPPSMPPTLRVILSPRGQLAVSEDLFNGHTWEGVEAKDAVNGLQCTEQPPQQTVSQPQGPVVKP